MTCIVGLRFSHAQSGLESTIIILLSLHTRGVADYGANDLIEFISFENIILDLSPESLSWVFAKSVCYL